MLAVFRQNSKHHAILTSGETGGITAEFDINISGISARFRWDSGRISKRFQIQYKIYRNTAQISEKFGQISRRNPSRIPMAFRRNSTGTPPECHWNSAELTSKDPSKIPAHFRQKNSLEIHRNTAEIPLVNSDKFPGESKRNSGSIPEFQWCYSVGIPVVFRRSSRHPGGLAICLFTFYFLTYCYEKNSLSYFYCNRVSSIQVSYGGVSYKKCV